MKIRIRKWDDMAKEYRIDCDGDIDVGISYFTTGMEKLMPEDRIIDVELMKNYAADAFKWQAESAGDCTIYLSFIESIIGVSKEEKAMINSYKPDVRKLFTDKYSLKNPVKYIAGGALVLALGAMTYKKVRG